MPVGQEPLDLGVERGQVGGASSSTLNGPVPPRDTQLVVVVEVVRRRDERDHAGEPLLADPDDLLLAPDAAMVGAVAAGTLAHGELVLDDPVEVPGRMPWAHLPFIATGLMLPRLSLLGRLDRHRGPGPCAAPCGHGPGGGGQRGLAAGSPTGGGDRGRPRPVVPDRLAACGPRRRIGQQPPEEALAAGARPAPGQPERDELVEVAQQGQVVRQGLAEADARDRPRPRRRPARGLRPPARPGRRGPRPPRRRSGVALHRLRGALHVHRHPADAELGGHLGHSEADTSLTRVAPAATAARATSGLTRVDRDPHRAAASASTTGTHPAQLLVAGSTGSAPAGSTRRRRRRCRRPRRSARRPWATRGVGVEEAAAVAERVGRDVDDAHHQRAHDSGRLTADATSPCQSGSDRARRAVGGVRAALMNRMASKRVAVFVAEQAPHGRGDRGGTRLAHAPHRHAQVLGLDHHQHARRAAACARSRRRSGW